FRTACPGRASCAGVAFVALRPDATRGSRRSDSARRPCRTDCAGITFVTFVAFGAGRSSGTDLACIAFWTDGASGASRTNSASLAGVALIALVTFGTGRANAAAGDVGAVEVPAPVRVWRKVATVGV